MSDDVDNMIIDIDGTIEDFVKGAGEDDTVADCASAIIDMLVKHYIK